MARVTTIEEFYNNAQGLESLRDICYEFGYEGDASKLVTEDEMDRNIDGRIADYLMYRYWRSLVDELNDIERGYEWYVDGGELDYRPVRDEEEFLSEERESVFEFICAVGGFLDEEEALCECEDQEEDELDAAYTADMLLSAYS